MHSIIIILFYFSVQTYSHVPEAITFDLGWLLGIPMQLISVLPRVNKTELQIFYFVTNQAYRQREHGFLDDVQLLGILFLYHFPQ